MTRQGDGIRYLHFTGSRWNQELLDRLPEQPRLNVDETGHRENGDQFWTWCFRAELFTLFKIDPTRSGDVLLDVLGSEFDGDSVVPKNP